MQMQVWHCCKVVFFLRWSYDFEVFVEGGLVERFARGVFVLKICQQWQRLYAVQEYNKLWGHLHLVASND